MGDTLQKSKVKNNETEMRVTCVFYFVFCKLLHINFYVSRGNIFHTKMMSYEYVIQPVLYLFGINYCLRNMC